MGALAQYVRTMCVTVQTVELLSGTGQVLRNRGGVGRSVDKDAAKQDARA
jgi:hypothetical protein